MDGSDQSEESFNSKLHSAPKPTSPVRSFVVTVTVLACTTVASLIYMLRSQHEAANMAASQEQTAKQLEQTRHELAALSQRMEALQTTPPVVVRPAEPAAIRAAAPNHSRTVTRPPAEDPRWRKMEEQIASNQQSIDRTQQSIDKTRTDIESELSSTRDGLNGSIDGLNTSIAKTHEELVALQRRGEQSYYEFDLNKSKQFTREGPLGLAVRKTDTKHGDYDVDLMVDDNKLSKKHVNLYEPVWIYPQGHRRPVELVINQIGKDRVHGYVSAPRYSEEDLARNSGPQSAYPATPNDTNNVQPRPDAGPNAAASRTAFQQRTPLP